MLKFRAGKSPDFFSIPEIRDPERHGCLTRRCEGREGDRPPPFFICNLTEATDQPVQTYRNLSRDYAPTSRFGTVSNVKSSQRLL
jgi:hypothetical protein